MGMNRAVHLVLMGGLVLGLSGCVATRNWVRGQLAPERERVAQIDQKVEAQATQVSETAGRLGGTQRAVEELGGRLQVVDGRLEQVGTEAARASTEAREGAASAREARGVAEEAVVAAREVEGRLDQRWKRRHAYAVLETRSVFFDFDRASLQDEGINMLAEIAAALRADPGAIVELVGYTDARGDDRYNLRLSRDRVDAVARHLVQKHGIDVRRIHAVGLGKAPNGPAAGATNAKDAMARSRRVDIRLLAPPA
jgi:outer membrane protein OmpA-like peptidoglycan-associated protein